jgi:hypothetical protein
MVRAAFWLRIFEAETQPEFARGHRAFESDFFSPALRDLIPTPPPVVVDEPHTYRLHRVMYFRTSFASATMLAIARF